MKRSAGIPLFAIGFLLFLVHSTSAQWIRAGKLGGDWVTALTVKGTYLFAATRKGGVFMSENKGITWTAINSGLPKRTDFQCLASCGQDLFVGGVKKGAFISSDDGASWAELNAGLPKQSSAFRFEVSGTDVFAVAGTKRSTVYRLADDRSGWIPANSGLPDSEVLCLAASGPDLFAGTGTPVTGRDACVFSSTDRGASWKAFNAGLPADNPIFRFAVIGQSLFAGSWHGGRVFGNTIHGEGWASVCFGLPDFMDFSLSDLAVSGRNLFLGSFKGVFWLREGSSWALISSGLPEDASVYCLAIGETDLFAGTEEGEIWRLPLSDLSIAANLSDPVLTEENWAAIHKDKPKAVFIPEQIKDMIQEGFIARKGRQEIPFSIVKWLFMPARSIPAAVILLNNDEPILTILPERYFTAGDFYQAVVFFKARNADLGYAAKAQPSDRESGQKDDPSDIREAEFKVFLEFRQKVAAGISRVVQEVFIPATIREKSATYDPDKENWYSANVILRPGEYTLGAAFASKDLNKVGVNYIDMDIPGPESYSRTLEMTPPFFIKHLEQMEEPDQVFLLHKNEFTYSLNEIVINIDNVLLPGEQMMISYFILGAIPKPRLEKEVWLEAAYEVQNEDGSVAIKWEPRDHNSAGITEVLPWKPTVMVWEEHGGKEVRGDLGPGKYNLVITVEDKMSGATIEKQIPFEVREKQ
jgi:photosystem II stability/assembly factor-like uncharacterized protein